ncbi:OsmC family peroxiredoxin [Segetibacter sp. 3557_3]|uniref:OsmC family protein n=1 Tax=Segetibacter sp. 3557_3 TaxID=2547429 RepID=UPI0010585600|nr:OsmC family protein [Segetibacter sp. 3557_3]TDH23358.1 OsmC family peroxiredoxin [Segetibacter sp. 3557_3]
MNADELKIIQGPIKEKYRNDPAAATITLKAQGEIGNGLSCKVDTGRAMIEAGLHPATGGDGMLACSGDLLLEALVACAGVTLSAVATAIGVKIKAGSVYAEGDLDFRGTLGVSKEVPVGFTSIRLGFRLQYAGEPDHDTVRSLLKLTERYCVIYQTIAAATPVQSAIEPL